MSYQERPPVAELTGIVAATWVHRVPAGAEPYRHRDVPSGCVELRCRMGASPEFIGALTRPREELLPPGTTVVGVRFRPGAATAVLGLPLSELTDLEVTADELWSREAGEQLFDGPAAMTRLQALVTSHLAADPDPLVAEAVRLLMPGRVHEVGTVQSALSISETQFRRRCQSAIGMAPKALHRILRFQGFLARAQFALARGRRPAEDGLGRLAADTGYADQAHLTRECVRLTGETPRAFLRQTEEQCGCEHDHAVSYGRFVQER